MKNKKLYIITCICLCIISFLVGINIKMSSFFEATLVDILMITIGSIAVFYLKEKNTDARRQIDCIEHIINEIELYVSDNDNFSINKNALIMQTSCANRIKYICEANITKIQEDVNFIKTHFEEIRNLYSNHMSNQEELDKVQIDINKHREVVLDKCSKIRIGLYSDYMRL